MYVVYARGASAVRSSSSITSRTEASPRACTTARASASSPWTAGGGELIRPTVVEAATGVPDATIAARSTILVDADGRSLYLFEKDKGTASTCYDACASAWPPVTPDAKAVAGTGIDAAKLGTTTRQDGVKEVTYSGHPLYSYAGDRKPGDTTGQDLDQFGAEWYVLAPTGRQIGG
jgi:predicted lipoprotein with Yx(FWY)xxD motif